jgi:hypothetical protein
MKFLFRMIVTIGVLVLIYALYLRSEGREFDAGREVSNAQRVASGAWKETKAIASRAHDEYESRRAAPSADPDEDREMDEEAVDQPERASRHTPFAELIRRLNRAVARLNGRES